MLPRARLAFALFPAIMFAYALEATGAGYEAATQTGVSVTDGSTTTVNISLQVPINYDGLQSNRLLKRSDV